MKNRRTKIRRPIPEEWGNLSSPPPLVSPPHGSGERYGLELVAAVEEWRSVPYHRRTFLTQLAALSALVSLRPIAAWPNPGKAGSAPDTKKAAPKQEPWQTLAVVQNHLFPTTPDGPGAREINAIGYLRNVLADPDFDREEREFIRNGVGWLEGIARKEQGTSFRGLSTDQREQVLRSIAESDAGERWLSTLLLYIFEALLSDPAYGGNPDAIGWKWLDHQPGFPRPPADKTHQRLRKL